VCYTLFLIWSRAFTFFECRLYRRRRHYAERHQSAGHPEIDRDILGMPIMNPSAAQDTILGYDRRASSASSESFSGEPRRAATDHDVAASRAEAVSGPEAEWRSDRVAMFPMPPKDWQASQSTSAGSSGSGSQLA
jgi:hypothetical protein